jgi:hypothetical protein
MNKPIIEMGFPGYFHTDECGSNIEYEVKAYPIHQWPDQFNKEFAGQKVYIRKLSTDVIEGQIVIRFGVEKGK